MECSLQVNILKLALLKITFLLVFLSNWFNKKSIGVLFDFLFLWQVTSALSHAGLEPSNLVLMSPKETNGQARQVMIFMYSQSLSLDLK